MPSTTGQKDRDFQFFHKLLGIIRYSRFASNAELGINNPRFPPSRLVRRLPPEFCRILAALCLRAGI